MIADESAVKALRRNLSGPLIGLIERTAMHLHPDARFRVSKRGLVLYGATGESALLEHARAAELPALVADDPDVPTLLRRLDEPSTSPLVDGLVQIGFLTEDDAVAPGLPTRAFSLSRDGLLISGIGTPAAWLERHLLPLLISVPGRITIGLLVVGALIGFISGRPDAPAVSSNPALEGVTVITIGLAAMVLHEFGHAVALVHFGARPSRAGFGFYWGGLSFFVDSTPGVALPRKQRVIQALAGLMVDTVTTSIFVIAAHLVSGELFRVVLWRLAVTSLVNMATNVAPVLQLDGHWALADLLDEPDLAARSRQALGAFLRRSGRPGRPDDRRLAAYGAISLVGGLALIVMGAVIYWSVAGHLVLALLHGNPLEIALGLYTIVPLVLGSLASIAGLVLETALKAPAAEPAADHLTAQPAA